MSIYATLWSVQIRDPAKPFDEPRWVEIWAQAVPAHIGSPTPGCGYESGDPYGDFLPPPVATDEQGEAPFHRAVVFVTNATKKGTTLHPQEYIDPVLVLPGEEYASLSFESLHDRLQMAIQSGPRVMAQFLDGGGNVRLITEDEVPPGPHVDTVAEILRRAVDEL